MRQRQAEIPLPRLRAAPRDPQPRRPHATDGRRRRQWVTIALFLTPALALYLLFVLAPILQAVYYSLFDWSGLGPITDFLGLDNYRRALTDTVLLSAIR